MNSFTDLTLSPTLHRNLARNNFSKPTPVQAQGIPPALLGRDVVATAQTGTGKTLAFVIPILHALETKPAAGIRAVVMCPTRELAIQIHGAFTKLTPGMTIRAALVVGGLSESPQIRSLKTAQIVIATPGRLCDFLNRKLINIRNVEICVLDEADRMLDMGFLPSIKLVLKEMPASRQTLLYSATVEKSVAHLVESSVRNPVRVSIGATTKPAENVNLHVYEVEQDRKLGLLNKLLNDEQGSFLVFARTKHGTDRLAKHLATAGVKAARIHGDRTQGQRNQALKGFQDGSYRVLVATDVAARGIHVDGIAHVVNYDLPQAPEDFIHRVGRTGRAGGRGTASTFGTRAERGDIRKIEQAIGVRLQPREVGVVPVTDRKAVAETPKVVTIRPRTHPFTPSRGSFTPSRGSFGRRAKGR